MTVGTRNGPVEARPGRRIAAGSIAGGRVPAGWLVLAAVAATVGVGAGCDGSDGDAKSARENGGSSGAAESGGTTGVGGSLGGSAGNRTGGSGGSAGSEPDPPGGASGGAGEGTGGGGPSSGAGGGGDDSCRAFLDDTLSEIPLTVTLVNQLETPVWLGPESACDYRPLFRAAGSEEEIKWIDLGTGCARALDTATCPQAGVCPPLYARLEPGESISFRWNGTDAEFLPFTAECTPSPTCRAQCARRRLAQPGEYSVEFTGRVYTACAGDACDACTGSPCRTDAALTLTQPTGITPESQSFRYPDVLDDTALITFRIVP